MIFDLSFFWIAVAVVVYMAIGALWYSPVLFAEPWMKALGKKKEDLKGNGTMYLIPAVSAVLIALMMAILGQALGISGVLAGAWFGLELWLAFVATTMLTNRVFQNGSMQLFSIDAGYYLVTFALTGAIVLH